MDEARVLNEMAFHLKEAKRHLDKVEGLRMKYRSLDEKADRNFRLDLQGAKGSVITALESYFPVDLVKD